MDRLLKPGTVNSSYSVFLTFSLNTSASKFFIGIIKKRTHPPLVCQRANVPKGVPNFQTFLLRNAKKNFYTLLHKKILILDIIVIHMICMFIEHTNCIILHFYTSCHIKENDLCGKKCPGFLFFENFVL